MRIEWAEFTLHTNRVLFEEDELVVVSGRERVFSETVVNLVLQHLANQFTFDSIAFTFRSNGWWYIVIKPNILNNNQWIVVLLDKTPSPKKWPTETETEFLRFSNAGHCHKDNNFFIFPCLEAIAADLPKFCAAIRNSQTLATDVLPIIAIVEGVVKAALSSEDNGAHTAIDIKLDSEDGNKTNGDDNIQIKKTRGSTSRDTYLELVQGVPTRDNINTLDDKQWLNDVMINYGLYVLGRRHSKGVFFYTTFLVEELLQKTSCAGWTKHANPAGLHYRADPRLWVRYATAPRRASVCGESRGSAR
ncbi:hypothetical protein SPI_08650 [Niveomyces insectorum RCEF 264]|uniref:Uncharacterized protein n=1 Tax=Niveomyces insectorum RCEF 264 TaxID=1081102 RepID=A0A167MUU0_9HYPO|nr:hypothetical protein SPI_08650 [Niveomyces insectorum RCEF 264]